MGIASDRDTKLEFEGRRHGAGSTVGGIAQGCPSLGGKGCPARVLSKEKGLGSAFGRQEPHDEIRKIAVGFEIGRFSEVRLCAQIFGRIAVGVRVR